MTHDDMHVAMKQATANAIALVTAMQSADTAVLDRELTETIQWIGVAKDAPASNRLALQLNQSAHLTTLCIELLAEASGWTVQQVTQRLAARIAGFNESK